MGESLPRVVDALPATPLFVVVLCPDAEVAAARDGARDKTGYSEAFTAKLFDRGLRDETPRLGLWLDTTALSVAATVDAVFTGPEAARVR